MGRISSFGTIPSVALQTRIIGMGGWVRIDRRYSENTGNGLAGLHEAGVCEFNVQLI